MLFFVLFRVTYKKANLIDISTGDGSVCVGTVGGLLDMTTGGSGGGNGYDSSPSHHPPSPQPTNYKTINNGGGGGSGGNGPNPDCKYNNYTLHHLIRHVYVYCSINVARIVIISDPI